MKAYLMVLIAATLTLNLPLLSASEPAYKYYFIYDTGAQYEKALQCEQYIEANTAWFVHQIREIIEKYNQNDITNAISTSEQSKFINFSNAYGIVHCLLNILGKLITFKRQILIYSL